jgi:hypothetical protein
MFFFCSRQKIYYIILLNQIEKELQMMKKDEKKEKKIKEIQAFPVTDKKSKIKMKKKERKKNERG